jgi:hypothetical protein
VRNSVRNDVRIRPAAPTSRVSGTTGARERSRP